MILQRFENKLLKHLWKTHTDFTYSGVEIAK
jgi:hypothetical protein